MTTVILVVLGILVLLGVTRKKKPSSAPAWRIGPVIRGQNYSPGMPSHPVPQGKGWYFDFPLDPRFHVHYVQLFNPPRLGSYIEIAFSVTGGPFVPQAYPDKPALVSLMIQRKGDDWSAVGPMQAYRWFSKAALPLEAGEHKLTVPLEVEAWGDVYGGQDPQAFADTLKNLDNIAVIFGSNGGRGHGVYATQPSRFTLLGLAS